jgi:sec-independent protein translocase protein TatA
MAVLPPVPLLFGTIGTGEILLLVLLVVLLFGAHRIPDLARSLGRAQREFQKARDQVEAETVYKTQPEDERVRKAAADLGIPVDGKTTDELKAEIAARMAGPQMKPA